MSKKIAKDRCAGLDVKTGSELSETEADYAVWPIAVDMHLRRSDGVGHDCGRAWARDGNAIEVVESIAD
jgi:hypothetical protein